MCMKMDSPYSIRGKPRVSNGRPALPLVRERRDVRGPSHKHEVRIRHRIDQARTIVESRTPRAMQSASNCSIASWMDGAMAPVILPRTSHSRTTVGAASDEVRSSAELHAFDL